MVEDGLKIEIIGSTKPGFILPKEDALIFGAHEAGICYMNQSFQDIVQEEEIKTIAREKITLSNGHQSVYGHTTYNLLLSGIPKILAMILNNEKVYTTSEKSARYTKMSPTPKEAELYAKWLLKFEKEIAKRYPQIDEKKIIKLAQENARYVTSVFTLTTMGYTTDFRQLNYLMHWFNEFIEQKADTSFNTQLKNAMMQFNDQLRNFYVAELNPEVKARSLSMFAAELPKHDVFDFVYSVNYEGSFAQLAQAQRHRTINYQMKQIESSDRFFMPPIIRDNKSLANEWAGDMLSVADLFPQGTLISINERGLVEDFISKAYERLCGQAQLEIMNQTKQTLEKYLLATKANNSEVYEKLILLSHGPRCTFPDYACVSGCDFGKKSLDRLI